MKTTALALAALLALSGTAFAGNLDTNKRPPATSCIETTNGAKLDCGTTGAIEKTHSAVDTSKATRPRLGIDVSPWILPGTF